MYSLDGQIVWIKIYKCISQRDELSTEQGCLLWESRVVIPSTYHQVILEELHAEYSGIKPNQSVCKKLHLVAWNGCCYREYGAEMCCMSVSEESTNCGTIAPMIHMNMAENPH